MKTRICLPVVLLLAVMVLAGCSGINAVVIDTMPPGAELTVNKEKVGPTPQKVPMNWNWFPPFFVWGDPLVLKMEKPGFQPLEHTIDYFDVHWLWMTGEDEKGSPYGDGNTFKFEFPLEPVGPDTQKSDVKK